MWKRVKKALAKRMHRHEYRLEMIAMNGHIVEVCDCGRRQVHLVNEDRSISRLEFTEKEWSSRAEWVLAMGGQMPWRDLDEVPPKDV